MKILKENVLTITDAAKLVGLSHSYLSEVIARGDLSTFQIGLITCIDRLVLREWRQVSSRDVDDVDVCIFDNGMMINSLDYISMTQVRKTVMDVNGVVDSVRSSIRSNPERFGAWKLSRHHTVYKEKLVSDFACVHFLDFVHEGSKIILKENVITASTAAKMIGTSRANISQAIKLGVLSSFRVGGVVCVDSFDFLRWRKKCDKDNPVNQSIVVHIEGTEIDTGDYISFASIPEFVRDVYPNANVNRLMDSVKSNSDELGVWKINKVVSVLPENGLLDHIKKLESESYWLENNRTAQNVIRLWDDGERNLSEIARCSNVSLVLVSRYLNKAGKRKPQKILGKTSRTKRDEDVIKMIKKGRTYRDIGEYFGFSSANVARIARKHRHN